MHEVLDYVSFLCFLYSLLISLHLGTFGSNICVTVVPEAMFIYVLIESLIRRGKNLHSLCEDQEQLLFPRAQGEVIQYSLMTVTECSPAEDGVMRVLQLGYILVYCWKSLNSTPWKSIFLSHPN